MSSYYLSYINFFIMRKRRIEYTRAAENTITISKIETDVYLPIGKE
jgi:hypothetical protein